MNSEQYENSDRLQVTGDRQESPVTHHSLLPVVVSPAPFKAPRVMTAEQGLSIKGIIDQMYEASGIPMECRDYALIVELNGEPITRDRWNIIPKMDDHVLICLPVHGGGGKSPLRIVLTIIVIAASIYFGGILGAAIAKSFALGTAAANTVTVLSTMALSSVGMMAVNAIAPLSQSSALAAQNKTYSDSPTYSIAANSNSANPFGSIPVVLGTHRQYPPYGSKPYTEIIGNEEYLRIHFIWGYGPLKIEDIKLDDTLLSQYADYEIETREGRVTDDPLTLIPNIVYQDQIGVELKASNGRLIRTPHAGVDELSVDISFPRGLVQFDDSGNRASITVQVLVEYREVGTSGWFIADVGFTSTGQTTSALRFGGRWKVDRAKNYEVALTRITADSSDDKILDTVYWTVLRGFLNEHPTSFPFPLAQTALRIKATNQLNGIIDNLNAVVSSYAPTWNGSAWAGEALTKNPAALYRLVLMHPANALARTAAQIDDATLGEWYGFCESKGYEFNMIRDFTASVPETLMDIAASARAGISLPDGIWGVIKDSGDQPVIQHITPRNSWGFESERNLFYPPHALRVKFKNQDKGYEWDECIVYDDGYSASNATLFESIELPGITKYDLVWKLTRYHIAQARLRPETYSVYQDFEHLVCRRGSKVRVSHDIPLWGGGWGRVKSLIIDEGDPTKTVGVTLDDKVIIEAGKTYACRFRLADESNTSLCLSVQNTPGEVSTITFQTSVPTASGPQAGDLAMFGEAERETVELLIKSIERSDNFTAKLIMVDVAADIYHADTGTIPAFNSQITKPVDITKIIPAVPSIASIKSGTSALEVFAGTVRPRIIVTIAPGSSGVRVGRYRVRYKPMADTAWTIVETLAENLSATLTEVSEGTTYMIQVQAVSIYGIESPWSNSSSETVIGQTEKPANVTGFSCNVVGAIAHLSWNPNTDLDLSHYRIRWSAATSGSSWGASVDIVERVGKPATSITVPAMVGTYMIKAVDFSGYESDTAAQIVTSIARVAGLNYVVSLTQPSWNGTGENAEYDAGLGGIVISSTDGVLDADEGTYTITDKIDLEGVFTVRASASMTVSGVDLASDLYDATDLYTIANLYGVDEGDFSVGIELQITNDDPDGTPSWSDWMPFIVGDYTARGFQFRLKLYGLPPNATPIVEAVTITLDMEDRVYPFSATVDAAGSAISFSPAFYAAPEIGISVLNGQAGDTYTISNKTAQGFTIAFTNGGTGVSRNISGIARGYGSKEVL